MVTNKLEPTLKSALNSSSPLPSSTSSFCFLKKITITPTRIIYCDHVAVAKNRVLRRFDDPNAFLLVDFADEERQSLCGGDSPLINRVREVLVWITLNNCIAQY